VVKVVKVVKAAERYAPLPMHGFFFFSLGWARSPLDSAPQD